MNDAWDAWERIRRMTVDELLTQTKLAGSALGINGYTTPEGYPFALVVAVGSPGNVQAVELLNELHIKMEAAATWTARANRPRCPGAWDGGRCAGLAGHDGDCYASARDRQSSGGRR